MLLCWCMKLNIIGSQGQISVSKFNPAVHVYNVKFRWSKIGQTYVVVVVVVVVFYPFVQLGT